MIIKIKLMKLLMPLKKGTIFPMNMMKHKSKNQSNHRLFQGLTILFIITLSACMPINDNQAKHSNKHELHAPASKKHSHSLPMKDIHKQVAEKPKTLQTHVYPFLLETEFNFYTPPKKTVEIVHTEPDKTKMNIFTFDSTDNFVQPKPIDKKKKREDAKIKDKQDHVAKIDNNIKQLNFSPFLKHKERYQYVYKLLAENGNMSAERIIKIFSSKRAKKKDMTPIRIMSKRVISKTRLRSKKQTKQIARKIKRHLKKYKKYYKELEETYGVNQEIAAALFYKETILGEFKNWKHESFTVLNTILGYMELPDKTEPRQRKRMQRVIKTSQQSLAELILYCEKYNIDILNKKFPSSFAGAIGIPQFLPMYLKYAISADNTTPNISKLNDAILSLGNILKNKFDWPGYMDLEMLNNIDEIRRRYKSYDDKNNKVSLCMSRDLEGYSLLSFYEKFSGIPNIDYVCQYSKCLMNYNFSSSYSLDILQFAYYVYQEN